MEFVCDGIFNEQCASKKAECNDLPIAVLMASTAWCLSIFHLPITVCGVYGRVHSECERMACITMAIVNICQTPDTNPFTHKIDNWSVRPFLEN